MTLVATDWLPSSAFTGKAVESALAGTLAAWQEAWFPRAAVSIARVRNPAEPGNDRRAGVVQGRVANAILSAAGKRVVLEKALDIDLSAGVLQADDHLLLDAFAGKMISDLVHRLDTVAGDQGSRAKLLELTISVAGTEAVCICLPLSALASALKAALQTRRPVQAPLRSRAEALGSHKVRVEGVLGQAKLSLSELRDLAVGDIVVLDRLLQEPVELELSETRRLVGRGRLATHQGRMSIHF